MLTVEYEKRIKGHTLTVMVVCTRAAHVWALRNQTYMQVSAVNFRRPRRPSIQAHNVFERRPLIRTIRVL